VPHEGPSASEDELIRWRDGRIARLMRPRSVGFVAAWEIPRTATGEVRRRVLRDRLAATLAVPARPEHRRNHGRSVAMTTAIQDLNDDPDGVAAWVARFPKARCVDRIFGPRGGHFRPIRDHAARLGVRIVDVRHECAAVNMAHAHAELTGGPGVAMVTAGRGVTDTVTAVADAFLARMPVLAIGGRASRPQADTGPLKDIPHVDILRPDRRRARIARAPGRAIRELDEAVALATGDAGEPGPVHVEIPTDAPRASVPERSAPDDRMRPKPRRVVHPDPALVAEAAAAVGAARRPVVITGRGAHRAGAALVRVLHASGAVHLDTRESRGLVPAAHPATVGATRGVAMGEADLAVLVGRKPDHQLGHGSPAVFPGARFLRIAGSAREPIDNRRGASEILGSPELAFDALAAALVEPCAEVDRAWTGGLRKRHLERAAGAGAGAGGAARPRTGAHGRIHPAAIFDALREVAAPDHVAVADGGDLPSFARVGPESGTHLDAAACGRLGVGVPDADAAALAFPGRQVGCVAGDGDYGLNAIKIDAAVRRGGKAVFVVSHNAASNIERLDQPSSYGGRVVGAELRRSDYAGMARAPGLRAERVEDPADLREAVARAPANAPALVDVATSRDAVSSDARKGLGFAPDHQPLIAGDEAERARRAGA
jgi:acetolactate synthase-1/2/3 large subunit